MATQVQFRGGTTSEHSTFTGVAREVTVDTTKKTVVVHDGSTAGGIPLAKESAATSAVAITGGSINGTTVGAATPTTGAFTTLSASSTVTLIGLTASTNLALDASKNVVSVTNTGTGNNVLSASPTLTGTIAGASLSLSSLTSGRVTFAGASGLLQDSASFVFDGSNVGLGAAAGGTTRLSVSASSGSLATFTQTGATGYGVTIVPGADTTYDAFTINNAANTLNKIRMFGNGNATFAGSVGIGTSSPNNNLEVYSSSNPSIAVTSTSASLYCYYGMAAGTVGGTLFTFGQSYSAVYPAGCTALANDTYGLILNATNASGILRFQTNATERMRIDSAGDLLLGTTSNTTNGGFIFATNFYGAGRSVQVIGHINGASSGDAYMIFNYNGTGIGSITQSGTTAVLYNTTSDQRVKTNIIDAPSGNIDDIKVRSFDWIADGSHQEYGMVAQELIEVAPYAVNKPENPDEMMGVDYSKLVPMMIREIQDLRARLAKAGL